MPSFSKMHTFDSFFCICSLYFIVIIYTKTKLNLKSFMACIIVVMGNALKYVP